jgi:prevent-host-death family protein
MKVARIAELKNNLSRYLEYVRAGDTVTILDRDEPVAQIIPTSKGSNQTESDQAWMDRLERKGLIRRGKGGMLEWLSKRKPARIAGRSLVKDLIEERKSG